MNNSLQIKVEHGLRYTTSEGSSSFYNNYSNNTPKLPTGLDIIKDGIYIRLEGYDIIRLYKSLVSPN